MDKQLVWEIPSWETACEFERSIHWSFPCLDSGPSFIPAGRITLGSILGSLALPSYIPYGIGESTSLALDLIRGFGNKCENFCFWKYGKPDEQIVLQ
jgi:hypothetical protein